MDSGAEPTVVLGCESLVKAFDGVYALSGVSLSFPGATIIAIIGPNGAGKTTLLNALTGFVEVDSGRCFCRGREITSLLPYRIARLGISRSFQELRLVFEVSVLENLMLAFANQAEEKPLSIVTRYSAPRQERENRERAFQLLQSVALESRAFSLAKELSHGQQKLLSLACCLATGADILMLDEPVSGVDPIMTFQILTFLRKLKASGKLIVFIEHNVRAVHEVADRVVVMDAGAVVADGLPGDVLLRSSVLEAYLGQGG